MKEDWLTVDPKEKEYDRIIFFFMCLTALGASIVILVFIFILFNP